MEGEVPRGEPRVLPLVRHGDDVVGVDVAPFRVAPGQAGGGRLRLSRIAVEPAREAEVIELLAPDYAGEGLPHDRSFLVRRILRPERCVVFIGVALARGHRVGKTRAEIEGGFRVVALEPQPQLDLGARRHCHAIARRHFRAAPFGIDRRGARDDVIVDFRPSGRASRPCRRTRAEGWFRFRRTEGRAHGRPDRVRP